MKFPAKASSDFAIAPMGNHIAICNAVVDLGMQPGRGMYPDPKHEVYIRFELPNESVTYTKDGQEITGPMSIGRRFTASMSAKANLRKFIEAWFGKAFPSDDAAADFDQSQLLGRKCLLNITHNEKGGKTYANIQNATPIPRGMPAEFKQHNGSLFYDLSNPDESAFRALPEWLQKTINERVSEVTPPRNGYDIRPLPDDTGPPTPPLSAYEFNDDIPF